MTMKSSNKAQDVLKQMSFKAGHRLHENIKHGMQEAFLPIEWQWRLTMAAIAFAVLLGFAVALRLGRPPETHAPEPIQPSTPALAEMVTSWSMSRAFAAGGLQALDEHFCKTSKLAGPRPACLSVQDLLEDSDNWHEL